MKTEMIEGWSVCLAKHGTVCVFRYSAPAAAWLEAGRTYRFDANGDPNPWMETQGECLGKGNQTAVFNFPEEGAKYFHVGGNNHFKVWSIDSGEGLGGEPKY